MSKKPKKGRQIISKYEVRGAAETMLQTVKRYLKDFGAHASLWWNSKRGYWQLTIQVRCQSQRDPLMDLLKKQIPTHFFAILRPV